MLLDYVVLAAPGLEKGLFARSWHIGQIKLVKGFHTSPCLCPSVQLEGLGEPSHQTTIGAFLVWKCFIWQGPRSLANFYHESGRLKRTASAFRCVPVPFEHCCANCSYECTDRRPETAYWIIDICHTIILIDILCSLIVSSRCAIFAYIVLQWIARGTFAEACGWLLLVINENN